MSAPAEQPKVTQKVTIDGVEFEIVAREKAVVDESVSHLTRAQGAVMSSVDRILLSDERVLFQCVHRVDPNCGYTSDNVRSVTAHQRVHGGKAVQAKADAAIAEANARAAALEEELKERKRRQSEGGKRAAETRIARQQAEANGTATTPTPKAKPNADEVAAANKELELAVTRVILTANAVDDAVEAHREAVLHLVKVVKNTPVIDPQILAKAQQYDVLKAALHGL